MIPKPIFDHARFDQWKQILDRYDAGELTDAQASRLLDDLRSKERQRFEEICPKEK
jgi:hypothetical protein